MSTHCPVELAELRYTSQVFNGDIECDYCYDLCTEDEMVEADSGELVCSRCKMDAICAFCGEFTFLYTNDLGPEVVIKADTNDAMRTKAHAVCAESYLMEGSNAE